MSAPASPPNDGQLMREAAHWFARMRGPEAEASRPAFEAWLARGALHRGAYNRAAEIFAMGKLLAEDEAEGERASADGTRSASAARPRGGRRLLALLATLLGIAALVILGLAVRATLPGTVPPSDMIAQRDARLDAGPGEARRVHLADGSTVELAPGTRLDVRLDDAVRRLDLRAGRARFEVARERRPFVVHAGGGSVTARGTIFEVMLSPARQVEVRLMEGAVDVRLPEPGGAPPARRLRPGEAIAFAALPSADPLPRPAAERPPGPQPARTEELDAVPLGELLARLNRDARRPIRLADPALASRRVSGRLTLEDAAALAPRLARLLDLELVESENEIVLRQPQPR